MALLSDIRLNEDITELISDGLINDSSTSEITTWSSSKTDTTKQDVLVSTTNIKTINSNSILGSGDLTVISAETYETVSKNLIGYPYAITYNGSDIDYITYDLGGGLSIIKTFNYTDGLLTTLVLSGDTPSGIDLTKTLNYTGDDLTSVEYS